jgi:hypothetical protein
VKIVWTSALLLIAVTAHAAPPQIQFQSGAVTASGVSPSGQVAWFSVAREATGAGSQIVRREAVVADGDGDGVVRMDLDKPVPPRSIWAAVDLKTGEYALATPESYPLREVTFAPGTIHPGAGGVDRLDVDGREFVELFVARPAVGAWALTLWDGAEGDEDGPANRRISGALSRLEPVDASPAPPATFKPGDVIVMMDANTMQVAAIRLPGGAR